MSQSTTTLTGAKRVTGSAIQVTHPAKSKDETGIKWLDKLFIGGLEFNRYGFYMIAILMIGIMGGIPVALGGLTSAASIAILIIPTMAVLVMILGVAPMRLLVWTFLITMIIDIVMIIAMIAMWGEPLSTLF